MLCGGGVWWGVGGGVGGGGGGLLLYRCGGLSHPMLFIPSPRPHCPYNVLCSALSPQVLLGIFFNVHSAVLIEDVPFTEADFEE